jgi:hypothetical protein
MHRFALFGGDASLKATSMFMLDEKVLDTMHSSILIPSFILFGSTTSILLNRTIWFFSKIRRCRTATTTAFQPRKEEADRCPCIKSGIVARAPMFAVRWHIQ